MLRWAVVGRFHLLKKVVLASWLGKWKRYPRGSERNM